MQTIITDGYTRDGYITAVEGLHAAMTFRFRPMLPEESDVFVDDSFWRRPPVQRRLMQAAGMAGKIERWDVVTPDKKPAEVTTENVRRLPRAVLAKLFDIIAGLAPSDPSPIGGGGEAAEEDEYTRRLLESAKTCRPIGAVEDEADRKN